VGKVIDAICGTFVFVAFLPLCVLSGLFWKDGDVDRQSAIIVVGGALTLLMYLGLIALVGD